MEPGDIERRTKMVHQRSESAANDPDAHRVFCSICVLSNFLEFRHLPKLFVLKFLPSVLDSPQRFASIAMVPCRFSMIFHVGSCLLLTQAVAL